MDRLSVGSSLFTIYDLATVICYNFLCAYPLVPTGFSPVPLCSTFLKCRFSFAISDKIFGPEPKFILYFEPDDAKSTKCGISISQILGIFGIFFSDWRLSSMHYGQMEKDSEIVWERDFFTSRMVQYILPMIALVMNSFINWMPLENWTCVENWMNDILVSCCLYPAQGFRRSTITMKKKDVLGSQRQHFPLLFVTFRHFCRDKSISNSNLSVFLEQAYSLGQNVTQVNFLFRKLFFAQGQGESRDGILMLLENKVVCIT